MRYATLEIELLTGVDMNFGKNKTGGYFTLRTDETNKILKIRPTVDDIGSLQIGDGTLDMDFKVFFGSASNYLLTDVGNNKITVNSSSALTTGNLRTLEVTAAFTAAATANSVEAFASVVTSNVRLGNWANAILGKVDFSTAGFVTGLAGVVCAELDMAAGAIGAGSYTCFEAELNVPTGAAGWGVSVPVSFLNGNAWGAGVAEFRDDGYIFNFTGLSTAAAGKIFDECTAAAASHALRILIDGVPYYIMLNSNVDA